ncbi:MAG: cobalt ECF transporter T component CbiQ [Actinocatenispora sp.]
MTLTASTDRRPGQTPEWLLRGEFGLCPCGCVGVRRRTSYLRKTLAGAAALLRQVMFAEDMAARPGLLQRLDPRAKLLGTLLMLVAVALVRNVPSLLAAYLVVLLVAAVSRVPLGFFVKRVWLFVPIFTGLVVLPATLSVVTPGHIVAVLWHWDGHPVGFTAQGLTSAGLIVSRVAVSISLVVLLTITTPWTRLLAGLRVLRVPTMFVLIIGMAYRYVFHLLTVVDEMYQARRARTPGRQRHDSSARAFVAAGAGVLIGRSHHLSEEVHQAMVARGFRGDAKVLERFRFRGTDLVFAAGVVLLAVLLLGGDWLLGR